MNAKAKGNRNEYRSRNRHIAAGAAVVRAGGSLGLFDLIALYGDCAWLIQVKSNRWPGGEEMHALVSFVCPRYARKVIERWDDYARVPLVREIV
jgi:Holliday junction resolvase